MKGWSWLKVRFVPDWRLLDLILSRFFKKLFTFSTDFSFLISRDLSCLLATINLVNVLQFPMYLSVSFLWLKATAFAHFSFCLLSSASSSSRSLSCFESLQNVNVRLDWFKMSDPAHRISLSSIYSDILMLECFLLTLQIPATCGSDNGPERILRSSLPWTPWTACHHLWLLPAMRWTQTVASPQLWFSLHAMGNIRNVPIVYIEKGSSWKPTDKFVGHGRPSLFDNLPVCIGPIVVFFEQVTFDLVHRPLKLPAEFPLSNKSRVLVIRRCSFRGVRHFFSITEVHVALLCVDYKHMYWQ